MSAFPFRTLAQVYAPEILPQQKDRLERLRSAFVREFGGDAPVVFARSPGRVNLIGEHIDYSDFSVLPMALTDKDIVIAVRFHASKAADTPTLRLANMDSKRFPSRSFAWSGGESFVDAIAIDATKHEWSNYFLSGYKGVLMALKESKGAAWVPVSMECMVDGSVPTGAGVSSSSAFVCCSALATLFAQGGDMSKETLTETAIASERFVGVESGGMDQSCSIFGIGDSALLIDFAPKLQVTPVPLPKTSPAPVFVIAHTLVTADKHVTAPVCYNLRVVETRMAAAILGKRLLTAAGKPDAWEHITRLRGLLQACWKEKLLGSKLSYAGDFNAEESLVPALEAILPLVETHLTRKDGYTREEMAQELGLSVLDIQKRYMSKFPVRAETFQLYRRTMHVFTEALRVYRFKQFCDGRQPSRSGNLLQDLGALMNESQASCRDLFDCSCPELDQLTQLAREHGALGSRLTGAGWGGCTVSLVPEEKVSSFLQALQQNYYARRPDAPKNLDEYVFASKPGMGATLIQW